MEVNIRMETQDDFNAVFEVNKLAFGQDNEARLVALLRNSSTFIPELSLVATIDGKLIGHILFSKIVITDEEHNEFESLALAPMAVIPEWQQKGIGGQLVKCGLDRAKQLKFKSVIVLGHEHYYPKFGFIPAGKWNIKAPFEVPQNAFMGLELVTDGFKGIHGTVQYPKVFETV